jgi:hypothetical protein
MRSLRTAIALLAASALLASCQSSDPLPDEGLSADDLAVQELVRKSVAAENAQDADAFLVLWTDEGLAEYDAGTRTEIEAGNSENFGAEKFQIEEFFITDVGGDTARVTVDATKLKPSFARPIFRVRFEAIRRGDTWFLNGFEFIGGPVPSEDLTVLNIDAKEYAFLHAVNELQGEFAMTFTNVGEEQHELTMFKAPDGTEFEAGAEALVGVDGSELTDLPAGYEAEHLSFAEPGDSTDIVFAEPLVPGVYFFACYIPKGGFGDQGPLDPKGEPHAELGMISRITVA